MLNTQAIEFSLYYLPLVDTPFLSRKVQTHLEQLTRIGGKWLGIAFLLYLLQGDVGTLVDLQLEDVDVFFRLHQDVHSSIGGMAFHLYIKTKQGKEHIHRIVEIQLLVAHQGIVAISEEGLQTVHEAFCVTCPNLPNEIGDVECRLVFLFGCVKRHQILDKALSHFPIGKSKR